MILDTFHLVDFVSLGNRLLYFVSLVQQKQSLTAFEQKGVTNIDCLIAPQTICLQFKPITPKTKSQKQESCGNIELRLASLNLSVTINFFQKGAVILNVVTSGMRQTIVLISPRRIEGVYENCVIVTCSCFASPIFSRIFQVEMLYSFFVPLTRHRSHVTENDREQKTSTGIEIDLDVALLSRYHHHQSGHRSMAAQPHRLSTFARETL
ncbi:hypothetical protein ISCGN_009362 [Ixodes scapularis]